MGARDNRRCGRALIVRAADALLACPLGRWHYGDSIGFEGLLVTSEILADPSYGAFAYGFMKSWSARPEPFRELDNTAPGHAICCVHEQTGDVQLLPAAQALVRFLRQRPMIAGVHTSFARAPLIEPYDGSTLPDGERDLLADPGPGVFVDCMHFDPPFFAHLGRMTGDRSLLDAGAEQAFAAATLLQDPSTGIFNHFYLARTQQRYGYGWSRGQGWALLGLLDVLELLGDGHPASERLGSSLRALADGLAATQHPSGHWPVLVDVPDAALEPSAALFFAAGLARGVRLGLLAPAMRQVADRALDAGLGAVREDGVVPASAAVWACTARGHYLAVRGGDAVPWGQGPLLLAAAEEARGAL